MIDIECMRRLLTFSHVLAKCSLLLVLRPIVIISIIIIAIAIIIIISTIIIIIISTIIKSVIIEFPYLPS